MYDRNTYLTATLAFVTGAVAGAAVALLTAPQSGQATRDMMDQKLRDTRESAREMKERLVRQAAELRAEASRRAEGVAAAISGRTSSDAISAS